MVESVAQPDYDRFVGLFEHHHKVYPSLSDCAPRLTGSTERGLCISFGQVRHAPIAERDIPNLQTRESRRILASFQKSQNGLIPWHECRHYPDKENLGCRATPPGCTPLVGWARVIRSNALGQKTKTRFAMNINLQLSCLYFVSESLGGMFPEDLRHSQPSPGAYSGNAIGLHTVAACQNMTHGSVPNREYRQLRTLRTITKSK